MNFIKKINAWFSAHEPWDKVAHFTIALLIAMAFVFISKAAWVVVIALGLPVALSILKELYIDEHFDIEDILATAIGAMTGIIIGLMRI